MSERLKEERSKLGMNQDEFAELGGVKRRAQSSYENGERTPDADYLSKIAAAGADVSYILTGIRSAQAIQPQGRIADAANIYRSNKDGYAPDDPRKQKIIDMLDGLDSEGLDRVQDAVSVAQQIKELRTQVKTLQKKAG